MDRIAQKLKNMKCPRWTERELITVKNYYLNTPSDVFYVKDIASVLDRSEAAITAKASKLGLGIPKRKACAEAKERMRVAQKTRVRGPEEIKCRSRAIKKWIAENGHPKGFAGKNHAEKAKKTISSKKKKNWADPKSPFNQNKYRQQLSDQFSGPKDYKQNPYSRAKGGKRKDLNNQYFRSAWEANIARYLNFLLKINQIKSWEYEPDTFWFEKIKRGIRSYTPDFKINGDYYIEVKGYMDAKSKTKLRRMAKYYPRVKVELLDETRYRKINKDFKHIIDFWE